MAPAHGSLCGVGGGIGSADAAVAAGQPSYYTRDSCSPAWRDVGKGGEEAKRGELGQLWLQEDYRFKLGWVGSRQAISSMSGSLCITGGEGLLQ